jgi:hypothetical protein
MKVILFFLVFVCGNSLRAQKARFEQYYPLKNGVIKIYYVSHITSAGSTKDENDSSICKSLSIKGKEVFYFDDKLHSSDTTIIGSQSFCSGAFYYHKGKFMFSPLFWKYELKGANLAYFETLFPALVTIGTMYTYRDGEEKRSYRFEGFEDIVIKNKLFKQCLVLTIISDWKTARYKDTVWFQKGLGVVKWLRSTGRLEEIKI